MDTGATSHMTHSQGTLINYFPLKYPHNNHIIVGNGNIILVHGHGNLPISSSHPSFTLKNVLHAPRLIKNLISVHKFTIDDNVFIEFDPLDFSVKELGTGTILLRSNSNGDLYPLTLSTGATISSSSPSAFTTLSSTIWHSRLVHLGDVILNSLRSSKIIDCNKTRLFCKSCPRKTY